MAGSVTYSPAQQSALADALMAYYGVDRATLFHNMREARSEMDRLWHQMSPGSSLERDEFYGSPWTLYRQALPYLDDTDESSIRGRFQSIAEEVLAGAYGAALEYGGGIGEISAWIAQQPGSRLVDSVEVPGMVRWLEFRRRRQGLDKLNPLDHNEYVWAPRSYDLIVSIDVLEHLDNPYEIAGLFAQSLKPNGRLIVKYVNYKDRPEHLPEALALYKETNDYLARRLVHLKHARHYELYRKGDR